MDELDSAKQKFFSSDILQSPDLYHECFDHLNDYVLIFNHDLRAVYTNNACFEFLNRPSSKRDYLIGKDFDVFAPDYREIEAWNRFMNLSTKSDSYYLDCYDAIGEIFRRPLFCEVQLLRYNEMLCAIVTETTENVLQKDILKRQEIRLYEIEEYCNKLKNTVEVLIDRKNEKENENEKRFICNLEETVFPILDLLKASQLDEHQVALLDTLYDNLNSPIDSFFKNHNTNEWTTREALIVNLIRQGKSTKEIANILCLSTKTVDYHRANIRKKLNINNSSNDLANYLRSMIES